MPLESLIASDGRLPFEVIFCCSFIFRTFCYRAVNFGIAYDGANIATVAANVMVPDFVPRKANIQTEENEKVLSWLLKDCMPSC